MAKQPMKAPTGKAHAELMQKIIKSPKLMHAYVRGYNKGLVKKHMEQMGAKIRPGGLFGR